MKRLSLLFFSFCFVLTLQSQDKNQYQVLVDSALTASSTNRFEAAVIFYRQVLEIDPNNVGNSLIYGNLGSVYERMGKIDEALECYSKALSLEPKLVPVLEQRSGIYLDKGEDAKALQDFNMILNQQPDNELALLGRAYLRMELKMFQESRMDFESLLLNYPQNKQGELGMAILSQKQGRFQESAELFANLIERFPTDPSLYEARGNMEREARWFELALIDYEEAGRLSKNDPVYNVMQALVYLDQNKKKSAKRMLERAVRDGMPFASLEEYFAKCK